MTKEVGSQKALLLCMVENVRFDFGEKFPCNLAGIYPNFSFGLASQVRGEKGGVDVTENSSGLT